MNDIIRSILGDSAEVLKSPCCQAPLQLTRYRIEHGAACSMCGKVYYQRASIIGLKSTAPIAAAVHCRVDVCPQFGESVLERIVIDDEESLACFQIDDVRIGHLSLFGSSESLSARYFAKEHLYRLSNCGKPAIWKPDHLISMHVTNVQARSAVFRATAVFTDVRDGSLFDFGSEEEKAYKDFAKTYPRFQSPAKETIDDATARMDRLRNSLFDAATVLRPCYICISSPAKADSLICRKCSESP